MKHVMIDLETLGKRAGCAILSIGACMFKPRAALDWTETAALIGSRFYVNVDPASCLAAGLHSDPSTERWWKEQSAEARAALEVDRLPLSEALMKFLTWWQNNDPEYIWSNGAAFDQPVLEAAMLAASFVQAPWKFWNSRCTRTLWDMAQVNHKMWPREGVAHNALDDAVHQARVCCMAAGHLFPPEPTEADLLSALPEWMRRAVAAAREEGARSEAEFPRSESWT